MSMRVVAGTALHGGSLAVGLVTESAMVALAAAIVATFSLLVILG